MSTARSPLNISPRSVVDCCLVVAINNETREVPSAISVTGTNTPCAGLLGQAPPTTAMATANTAKRLLGALTVTAFGPDSARPVV